MASIPTLQDRHIPDVSSKVSDAQVINSAFGLASTTAQIGAKYKQARDTTQTNEKYAEFQAEINNDWAEFQRTADPETLSDDWDKYYTEKKQTFLSNVNISDSAKNSLDSILTMEGIKQQPEIQKTQRKLQLDSYTNSIENTARNNNLMAYRGGKNLDLNSLQQAEKIIQGNAIAGSTIMSGDKLQESIRTQTEGAYTNFIKGVAVTDPDQAEQLLEDEGIQNKLGNVESIDKLKSYIKSAKKARDDGANIEVQTELQSNYENFDIGFKEGKGDIIKNEDLDNVDSLMSFRDSVREAYGNGDIKDTQYKNWISKTNSVFVNKIKEKKLATDWKSYIPFITSVNEQLEDDLNTQFKDNPNISDSEFVGVYEDTIKQLQQEQIGLKDSDTDSLVKAQDIFNKNVEKRMQLRTGRSDAQTTIVGNKILPLNSQAQSTGQILDNGGWQVEEQNGQLFDIRRDSNGKVLEWRTR